MLVTVITLKHNQHTHRHIYIYTQRLHTARSSVLLLNLAPLQAISCCGSHLKVFFESPCFITRSSRVIPQSDRSLLSLTVCRTAFSSDCVPVAASTITPLRVFRSQLEYGDIGPGQVLFPGGQQSYRGNINVPTAVTVLH